MTDPGTLYALTAAALIGFGLYGFVVRRSLLRRIIAFNVIGSGIFLYFGAVSLRGTEIDSVPHALIITGIVVALSATALAVSLAVAYARITGRDSLTKDAR